MPAIFMGGGISPTNGWAPLRIGDPPTMTILKILIHRLRTSLAVIIKNSKAPVRVSVTAGLFGGLIFVLATRPWLSTVGLVVLGVALAPIYPGMMSQTPSRLGSLSDFAIGFQVAAAMAGQVLIPSVGGLLVKTHGFAWLNAMLGVLLLLLLDCSQRAILERAATPLVAAENSSVEGHVRKAYLLIKRQRTSNARSLHALSNSATND